MRVQLRDWFFGLFGRDARTAEGRPRGRGEATHVIILDGTMSSLKPGFETNAGTTLKLLQEAGQQANLSVYYEAGIQWRDWSGTWGVMTGKGINRQIERAYGVLASRYKPGDRIILIGYSRGAYAVRSLAGVIERVGLVKAEHATVRAITNAYRHYRAGATGPAAERFRELYCYPDVKIEAVAVWDTVKALGLRLPIVWRWAQSTHQFHNHALGDHVRNGFHALALDETREAYAPVLWERPSNWTGTMEQVWFRGSHGDIGGQVGEQRNARPLANVPLVWILSKLEACNLPLPLDWKDRFPQDANAPSVGTWSGWSKIFWSRRRRIVGRDPSETLHETVNPAGYKKSFVAKFAEKLGTISVSRKRHNQASS